MRRRRFLTAAVAAFAAAAIVPVASALAPSPGEIRGDYASNGEVSGPYSTAALGRGLDDPTLQVKADATVEPSAKPAVQQALGAKAELEATKKKRRLPFTGLDLGLMVVGGALVLCVSLSRAALGRARRYRREREDEREPRSVEA